jgi:hypothetical protein
MEEVSGLCGFRCDLCQFYNKNIKDEKHKETVSKEFSKIFGYDVKPCDVECVGCRDEGKHADANCPVRPCAIEKGVKNCAYCQEFICDKLKERMSFIEDFLQKNKEPIPKEDFDKYVEPYKSRERLEAIRREISKCE